MATMCIDYTFFLPLHLQAHSRCLGTADHDGLYPDLSPFHSLRREVAGSAPEAFRGSAGGRLNTCGRRASLSHIYDNGTQCLNDRNNNNNSNRNSSGSYYDNKILCNSNKNHYLYTDWRDEEKPHSNMFSFQNCTLQSEDAGNGDSYWVSFEEKSFCKGKAFKVYSGKMNGRGKKSGDRCVVKVFRKCMGTKSLCSCEMKKSESVRELARVFNRSAQKRDVYLRFAATYWALMDEVSRLKTIFFSGERPLSSKEAVLFEDDVRIDGERPNKSRRLSTFMDARGRPGGSRATELDAFMHFSYHESGGRLVVCGLEGVHDCEGFYLKTPTIHSRTREFGNSDGGLPGIREVFRHHVCNSVCKDMSKPVHNEEGSEEGENIPFIAECATSGVHGSFSKNRNESMPSTDSSTGFVSQNSHVSQISSISNASNTADIREVPSAPELPCNYHDISRSVSCPPNQYGSPEPTGASWITRDGSSAGLLPDQRASYVHQNSLPNTLLASTPQTYRTRDTININSATRNMTDLHIQDENANPWQHTDGPSPTAKVTDPCTGATSLSPPTSSGKVDCSAERQRSVEELSSSHSVHSTNLAMARQLPPCRLVSEPCSHYCPVSGDANPGHAYTSTRQSPQCEHAMLEQPPSYMDSQIATALWVMQRSYGCVPATPPSTQSVPAWDQPPRQPQGVVSTPHNDNH